MHISTQSSALQKYNFSYAIDLLMKNMSRISTRFFVMAFCLAVVSCGGGVKVERESVPNSEREVAKRGEVSKYDNMRESIFGEDGLSFFNSGKSSGGGDDGGAGLGVNSYLWRATLDTISFMPITSADPFGGVILTDWHSSASSPNERFKLNVYVLGRKLRADGVRVSVFRQVLQNQIWRDAPVPTDIGRKIEDAFLTRARQLRNEVLGQE